MQFFKLDLPASLDPFVDHMSAFADYMPEHDREIIVPDGATYLIVDLGDRPKMLFSSPLAKEGIAFEQAWFSGVHLAPITIEAQRGASLLVMRFRPGGANALLGIDAQGLAGRVEAMEGFMDEDAQKMRGSILAVDSLEAKLIAAARWLEARAQTAMPPDQAVRQLLDAMADDPNLSIERFIKDAGGGLRRVRDAFSRSVGVSPKSYARIMRFQKAVGVLTGMAGFPSPDRSADMSNRPLRWVELADLCGYADQAHFSREFQTFTGMSPSHFAKHFPQRPNFLPISLDQNLLD